MKLLQFQDKQMKMKHHSYKDYNYTDNVLVEVERINFQMIVLICCLIYLAKIWLPRML